MRSDTGESVIRLLLEAGVLDDKDVKAVQSEQKEALLSIMIERRVLLPNEIQETRAILSEMMEGSNQTKRLKAKASLVAIITANLHRRLGTAQEGVRIQKERVTADYMALAAARSKG